VQVAGVSDDDLRVHYCLEAVDRVANDPDTTAFKRGARLHQALWREARDYPIGTQPMRPTPGRPSRRLGSRIAIEYALERGVNFLSDEARDAAGNRVDHPQPNQTLSVDRLYCDLLSSMPMCFNLFAPLKADPALADTALHAWWPDVPGRVRAVHFEWSPGRRLRGEYLENRSAFDVAFELDLDDGGRGVLGIETKYHEDCRPEKSPSLERLRRYKAVTAASGAFRPEALRSIIGTDLQQVWLDHLLALSMTQHHSGQWSWAGFALVHPAGNPSYARATERYQALLEPGFAIRVSTLESLLGARVLPTGAADRFAERYLWYL
jgi:hypothetical protein